MAFQFFNPAPVFFDLLGVEPIMGGTVTFYDKGTTNLRNTWSREEQGNAYLNTNPIVLDAAGRSPTQIWMDGDYSYTIRDAEGVTIRTGDFTSGQTAGATIPTLDNGKYLTNDGTNLFWNTIRQVPDPSGMNDRLLSTDGANLLWVERPEPPVIPDPDIVLTSVPLTFRAGVEDVSTKFYIQASTGSAPASGANTTQSEVTFATPFATTPIVTLTPTVAQGGSSGYLPAYTVIAKSTTGFTVKFDTNAGQDSGGRINNAIAFDYIAFGTVIVPTDE